jgi:uncharacterized repeat protein (TIGR01451 family)
MKVFSGFRLAALVALVCTWTSLSAVAQVGLDGTNNNNFFFAMYGPTSAALNSSITYTIYITNQSALVVQSVWVTNTLPDNVNFVIANFDFGTTITTSSNVVFRVTDIPIGAEIPMSVTIRPRAAGTIVNSAVLSSIQLTNQLSASITTAVTNSQVANLGLSLATPSQALITNDYFNVNVIVTNAGPSDATNVRLTNSLPAGMYYVGITPSRIQVTRSGTNFVANLGTVPSGGITNVAVRVASTNVGTSVFSAVVTGPDNSDSDTLNNAGSTNVVLQAYGAAQLTVTNNPDQVFDPQTGVMEQTIVVSNTGATVAGSVRVVVSGLATNRFDSAVGTNGGNGYVVRAAPLAPGGSVTLMLQYYVPTHRPVNASFQAFEVPFYTTAAPAAPGTPVNGVRIFPLTSGVLSNSIYLDFPSVSNRTYTVVYSDDASFSSARVALPVARAAANYAEWIDFGPPATLTHPSNSPSRFYRVYLNPQ